MKCFRLRCYVKYRFLVFGSPDVSVCNVPYFVIEKYSCAKIYSVLVKIPKR
jgi:hypothetical protein